MKKAIISIFALMSFSFAMADVDFTQAINQTSMPTDAEIMQTLDRFNFTPEQKQQLFKETKRKLEAMYSGENPEQTNRELNEYYGTLQTSEDMAQIVGEDIKTETAQGVKKITKLKDRTSNGITPRETAKSKKYGPSR